jgi:RNA polymerase primary sigma factor
MSYIPKDSDGLDYESLSGNMSSDLYNATNPLADVMATIVDSENHSVDDIEYESSKKFEDLKNSDHGADFRYEDSDFRVADLVKMYLKEMGQVDLLSREEEVEIAKRIEHGEREIINSILKTTVGLEGVSAIRRKLETDELRLKEVVKDADDDDDTQAESTRKRDQVINLIKEIEKRSKTRPGTSSASRPKGPPRPRRGSSPSTIASPATAGTSRASSRSSSSSSANTTSWSSSSGPGSRASSPTSRSSRRAARSSRSRTPSRSRPSASRS